MIVTDEQKIFLLRRAEELCRARGASLLYLTLFGSALYGTESPGKSDLDVRGIFLPSLESLFLGRAAGGLHFSSGDGERKNSAGDVDIDLWSARRWLLELLPQGDMGALDLLFSPAHEACVLYKSPLLDAVFANPLRLVDTGNPAYAQYSLRQAKKYGIKGSRLGALLAVRDWLQIHCPSPQKHERLGDCLEPLAAACADERFCSLEMLQAEKALQLCGKLHTASTRMPEFINRVEAEARLYGTQAEAAREGEGVDFKALSHALRAMDQLEELLLTGRIVFPLKNRAELLAVKEGKYAWPELEERILMRIAELDALRKTAPFKGEYDSAFAEGCVLSLSENIPKQKKL